MLIFIEIVVMNSCECGTSSGQLKSFYCTGETDFRRCPKCGLVFRDKFPMPDELNDIYREAYETDKINGGDTNQESGQFASQKYAEFVCSALRQKSGNVLDYGSGSGELVELLQKQGVVANGLEFSSDARKFCEDTRGITLYHDLTECENEHYDIVTMIEVIEHLTYIKGALDEIYQVLKPGGKLIITTPNRTGLRARWEKGEWKEARKKFHLFLFDFFSLKCCLERSGYKDIRLIRFSPVQRPGLFSWAYARVSQLVGMPGTLCVIAKRGS